MTFQDFEQEAIQFFQEKLDDSYQIFTQEFKKNNDTILHGLIAIHPTINISPTLYLEPYYFHYLDGQPLDEVKENLWKNYKDHLPEESYDIEQFVNFDKAKNRIIYKLINKERNKEFLSNIPSIDFLDLSIIFLYYADDANLGYATITVTNEHLEYWNITSEALYHYAKENTPRLLPSEITSLMDYVKQYTNEDNEFEVPILIITNNQKLHGSSVILYDNILEQISNSLNSDLILIPSSVHEFLALPAKYDSIEWLNQYICEVNETMLHDSEVLSEHYYYYSKNNKNLSCAA